MIGRHYGRMTFAVLGLLLLLFESLALNNKDFDIFIGASRLVEEGKTCYEVWLKSGTSGLKYFYSPLFAVLLFPLNSLPQPAYNLVWMALSFAFIWRSFSLLSFFLPVSILSDRQRIWFWSLAVASVARMILDNLALGQMTPFLVWGTLESMRLVVLKRYVAGAALLALIINIKIIPLAVLLYLLYKKEWKASVLTCVFLAVYLFLPAVFIGYDFNLQLLHDWLSSLTATQEKSIYDDIGRASLSGLIPSLLLETPVQFSTPRNFTIADEHTVLVVLNVVRLLLLTVLAVLFGKPFKAIRNREQLIYDLSLVCLATPLIFPHQGKYAYFCLLPAYAVCIYWLLSQAQLKKNIRKKNYRIVLTFTAASFALVTLTTDGLIGRRASDFTEYLHFIVYGALCLLGAMAAIRSQWNTDNAG